MPDLRPVNRLIGEKSPYLLQHAHNPVDWYPWGDEAFAKARSENKPIFLSIGYSSCYWCHVMEREVFEHPAIAAQLNAAAVCIKVDREERPDVDRVYMSALQAMSGSGGWPLSMFLTPGLEPFFGATYIPPESRYGRPGFPEILRQISRLWQSEREKIISTGTQIAAFLRSSEPAESRPVTPAALDAAFSSFVRLFDPDHAGFGSAPKFPRPAGLRFLLRYYKRSGEPRALSMTLETLRAMARGGMYDQIGGGFHRYSVDARWHVPHFEKMLYDQAQLASLYLEAFQCSGDPFFSDIACETLGYIAGNLTDPGGGFTTSEDAESAPDPAEPEKREEGAFYCWTAADIGAALGSELAPLFCFHFGVLDRGNVDHDPSGIFRDRNVLYRAHTTEETARQFSLTPDRCAKLLQKARAKLFSARAARPHPRLDRKIITAWNGLAISAFTLAWEIFGNRTYLDAAEKAAEFILSACRRDGRLLRRSCDGESRFEGTLQDYAFFIAGLTDLFEATGAVRWLTAALELTTVQTALFADPAGGFFDAVEDPRLIIRTREQYDGAEPAGNSVAALNLLRLGHLTGNAAFRSAGEAAIASFGSVLEKSPESLPALLIATDWLASPPVEIVVAIPAGSLFPEAVRETIHRRFLPVKTVVWQTGSDGALTEIVPGLGGKAASGASPALYLCSGFACQQPTTDIREFSRLLDRLSAAGS